jgi:four helix bundle protein
MSLNIQVEEEGNNRFEKLKIYHKAHSFVIKIYHATNTFPKYEILGMTSQIRRASVSVTANIVEGNARNHKKEFIQFLYLSNGSLEEVKYYLILCKDLGYISEMSYNELKADAEEVSKMLNSLIRYWKNKS